MAPQRKVIVAGLLSYVAWGLFPLYWRFLNDLQPSELLAQRLIWSFVFYLGLLGWLRLRGHSIGNRPSWKAWVIASVAGGILAVNWGLYIYAVHTGRVLESSLAYFLNPILNVAVGVLAFREPFPWAMRIAVLLATLGIGSQLVGSEDFPWIAVSLALTFCAYGLTKKISQTDAVLGLIMEGAAGLLPAIAAAVVLRQQSPVAELSVRHWILLMGTGFVTGLPLLLFAYAAPRLPYSLLGIMQFLAPTLQFLVGWLVFDESLSMSRLWAFALVWIGVVFYLIDRLVRLGMSSNSDEAVSPVPVSEEPIS